MLTVVRNKKFIIIAISALVVASVVAGYFYIQNDDENTPAEQGVTQSICHEQIDDYNEAFSELTQSGGSEELFKDISKKIESTENYESDPTCLYMLADHFMQKHNEAKVESLLAQINELQTSEIKLSERLISGDVDRISSWLELVEVQQQQLIDNSFNIEGT